MKENLLPFSPAHAHHTFESLVYLCVSDVTSDNVWICLKPLLKKKPVTFLTEELQVFY